MKRSELKSRKLDIVVGIFIIGLVSFALGVQGGYSWTGTWNSLSDGYMEVQNVNATEYYRSGDNYTAWIESTVGATNITGISRGPWQFYVYRNGSDLTVMNETGNLVYSDNNKSASIQYAVDNLNIRGGTIFLGNMEVDINYPIMIVEKTNIVIEGMSSSTQTSTSYMGATQLNNAIVGNALFIIQDCEGITVRNIYIYTGRTDNYGIIINGTTTYPEHFLIEGNQFRKLIRGILAINVWASNIAGEIRNNHFSTTYDTTLGPGYCIEFQDANAWILKGNVIAGNARKGNGILFNDGDTARTPRVDMYANQFIGLNESAIEINSTGRFVGINVYGGNMETLDTTYGRAFVLFSDVGSWATITFYGVTFQTINGHYLVESDDTTTPIKVTFITPYCQGAYAVNKTANMDIKVINPYNFNVSNLDGASITATNPSGKAFPTGTSYFSPMGQLTSTTVEARTQWTVTEDGYIKNFRVRATSAATAGNVTVRVDGVSSAGFITLTGGGGDGWYTDTSHHIAVSDGEVVSLMLVSTDATTLYAFEMEYVTGS